MWLTLCRKSILNWKMLLTVVLGAGMMIASFFYQGYIRPGMFFTETDMFTLYTVPFATSAFIIFCGVFPAIPYAYSYIEERSSGYLRFIRIRQPYKIYAVQKILFTGLSGGASMLFMGIIVFGLIDIMGADITPDNYQPILDTLIWAPYMFVWGGRMIFILKCVLLFLFGFMWSELALMISLIFKNKYVAFVLPFLLYEIAWILIPWNNVNPVYLVRSDFDLNMPIWFPFIVDLIYIAVLVAINGFMFRRQRRK